MHNTTTTFGVKREELLEPPSTYTGDDRLLTVTYAETEEGFFARSCPHCQYTACPKCGVCPECMDMIQAGNFEEDVWSFGHYLRQAIVRAIVASTPGGSPKTLEKLTAFVQACLSLPEVAEVICHKDYFFGKKYEEVWVLLRPTPSRELDLYGITTMRDKQKIKELADEMLGTHMGHQEKGYPDVNVGLATIQHPGNTVILPDNSRALLPALTETQPVFKKFGWQRHHYIHNQQYCEQHNG